MTDLLKRFVDYVIDRGADRVSERMFERYGDDMANFITNATNVFLNPIAATNPPTEPPLPGLRSV